MKLDQALLKVGATIVKVEQGETRVVLLMRIDQAKARYWTETVTEFLLAASEKPQGWSADASKYFFAVPASGVVKFLWRVILLGDVRAAAEALGRASQRVVQGTVEVMSQPLVGRKEYEFDPARGKFKGPQPLDSAGSLIGQSGSSS